jgi:signal transduction histidine kinase/DNA-binding NarL/FixJ family response regulator
MRSLTIRAKLLLVVGIGFLATSLVTVYALDRILVADIDETQSRLFAERLNSIRSLLERKQDLLQKTGMEGAYRRGLQEAAVKELAAKYYAGDAQGSYPAIVDAQGRVVLHPNLPPGDESLMTLDFMPTLLLSFSGSMEYEYLGQAKWCMFETYEPWQWTIVYSMPKDVKYAEVSRLRTTLLLIILATGATVTAAISVLVSMTTAPIRQLTLAATRMAAGDLDQKVDTARCDEIGTLAGSFTDMCQAIRQKIRSLDAEVAERRRAELKLSELNTTLEQRVEERTAELTRANEDLQEHIRQRERTEAQLRQSQDALCTAMQAAEAANKAKGEFLVNMSHEIRTPLTSVLGYAELLAEGESPSPEQKEYLEAILRNGRHLLSLISDILDFSKIESGRLELCMSRTSVHSLVTGVASMLRVRAQEQRLSFTVDFEGEIPETILADEARLRQGLINLAGNAIKFTHNGGVRISAAFVPDWRGRPVVRIDVIDTGIGIPPDKLAQLCQPFVQADASTSRRFGGTGLGLAITRKLLEIMGGQLEIASKPGEGSIFSMIVPTGPLDGVRMIRGFREAAEAPQPAAEAPSCATLYGVSVLLAEDGPDNRRLISTILCKAGADVALAENGQEAVALAATRSFDVVLMDMQMPVMDGYEAAWRLRDSGFTAPIIALTAHALSFDREKCLSSGCTDYMAKPIKRAALVAAVASHAGRRPGQPSAGDVCRATTGRTAAPARHPDAHLEQGPIASEFAADADLADIIQEFVAGLPAQVQAMHDALASGAPAELRRLAHCLKGAGGSYGYPCLTEEARRLEAAAGAGDNAAACEILDRLCSVCDRVTQGVAATVPAGD